MKQIDTSKAAPKLEWVRPELKQIVAGAAESRDGNVNDGSGQQAS